MPTARQLHGRGMARKRSEIDMRFRWCVRFYWNLKLKLGYSLKTRWSHQLMEETVFQPVIVVRIR